MQLPRNVTLGLGILIILSGCLWEVPHTNPVDPEHYQYAPMGDLTVTVRSSADSSAIGSAEVKIPRAGQVRITDSTGIAIFEKLIAQRYAVLVERRISGLRAFLQDTLGVDVEEGRTVELPVYLTPAALENGSLTVKVVNLAQQPIESARVSVPDHLLSGICDSDGLIAFPNVPPGEWLVQASRVDSDPYYVLNSIAATIEPGSHTRVNISLDARPNIQEASALSQTEGPVRIDGETRYSVRLKAKVVDPDGDADLKYVVWSLGEDTKDTMSWSPEADSLFWYAVIPDDDLPNGSIDEALNRHFNIEATDGLGNSASRRVRLIRIIHDLPRLIQAASVPQPVLEWTYYYTNDFGEDTTQFRYLVRILQSDEPRSTVRYQVLLSPSQNFQMQHKVAETLQIGETYFWYVYVVDMAGNSSRSRKGNIANVSEP